MNIKINLVPDAIQAQRHEALLKRYATAALFGWLGLLLIFGCTLWAVQSYRQSQLNALEDENQRLEDEVNSEKNVEFRREAKIVQTGLDILSDLFSSQQSTTKLLETLTSTLDKDVVIDDINISDDVVRLDASTNNVESISSTVVALEQSADTYLDTGLGYFVNVGLGTVVNDVDDGVYSFSISAVYLPPVPQAQDEQADDTEEPVNQLDATEEN